MTRADKIPDSWLKNTAVITIHGEGEIQATYAARGQTVISIRVPNETEITKQ